MAYTRVWDSATPLGSTAANQIDENIRNVKGDLEERLEDKLITDITLDPWVVRPEILGNVVSKTIAIHPAAFVGQEAQSTIQYNRSNVHLSVTEIGGVGAGAQDVFAPLVLPPGVTLQQLAFTINRQLLNVVTEIGYTSGGAFVSVASATHTILTGIQVYTMNALGHLIVTSRNYVLRVNLPYNNLSEGSRLYGCKVTYDTPDCRNTI